MGGPKNSGEISGERKNYFRPDGEEIKFAVPHRSVCSSEMSPLPPDKISLGIINKLLSEKLRGAKTYKICVDGE